MLRVIHTGFKDTLRFNIAALLRRSAKGDTTLPPISAYSRNGTRRATLMVSRVATYILTTDTTSPGKRKLSNLQGAIYCEPTTAPHY
jgi:hypothetical protein